VQIFLIERRRANLVLDKAAFAGVAGSYVEESQRSTKLNLPLAAD
jgi:hypothetical protein